MSNGKGAALVLIAGAAAGGFYLWSAREDRQRADDLRMYQAEQQWQQQQQSLARQSGGNRSTVSQFAPLLDWGIGQIMNSNNNNGRGGGLGGLLGRVFGGGGGGARPSGGKTPGGKGQGGTTRLSVASAPRISQPPQQAEGGLAGLLSLIGGIEAPQGYDQVFGGVVTRPPRPITTMTVGEVMRWQRDTVSAGSPSSAAGRYQIIGPTLRGLVRDGQASENDLFDASTQERLARSLMERRGLSSYQSGRISEDQFAQNLSQEWASLPVAIQDRRGRAAQGQSFYAGDGLNRSLTTLDRVMAAIRGIS